MEALRLLRALRPLRLISQNEPLKVITNSLFRTLPSLRNLLIVTGTLIVIGAINGVQMYQGYSKYCDGVTILNITTSTVNIPIQILIFRTALIIKAS